MKSFYLPILFRTGGIVTAIAFAGLGFFVIGLIYVCNGCPDKVSELPDNSVIVFAAVDSRDDDRQGVYFLALPSVLIVEYDGDKAKVKVKENTQAARYYKLPYTKTLDRKIHQLLDQRRDGLGKVMAYIEGEFVLIQ
jgi:hypothetical protein